MIPPVSDFVASYSAEQRSEIQFSWNGKHASEFEDTNQAARWAVVEYCLSHPALASPELLEHLFLADADWAAEAWGAPHHFAQLGALLLERAGEQALPAFAEGFNRSFDTFGACHAISLSPALAASLATHSRVLATNAADARSRSVLEATSELLAKIQVGDASSGWATAAPGTPVANVRIAYPLWYHKAWQAMRAWFGANAA